MKAFRTWIFVCLLLIISWTQTCVSFFQIKPSFRSRNVVVKRNANKVPPATVQIEKAEIPTIDISKEMKQSFLSYAMSTILDRALPDVRDGLKPVHRRVLYAMYMLGLTPDSSFRKCARIVGEVLGKFHPHGDQSVYDALVRMSQDFVTLHPLVNGHGNFGSIDGDPSAAMRYTEAKLTHLAYDGLMLDIKENTVKMVPNFDGNEQEVDIMPARIPLILINGATGIAVGMSTNIPPHNLKEVMSGMIALIRNPNMTHIQMREFIHGPDFPTGGTILGKQGIEDLHSSGKGSIVLRAKSSIETTNISKNRRATSIIITEVPYLMNKALIVERIANLVENKVLEGISDVRDESDRDGIRVAIDLKKDGNPHIIMNKLYKNALLQSTFSGNFVVLGDEGTQPKRLNLLEILSSFIEFRFETIRKRTAYQLQKNQDRAHIVEGLLRAMESMEALLKVIKTSKDTAATKQIFFSEPYNFSEAQTDAILGLTLRRLTSLERQKLVDELTTLREHISQYQVIMANDSAVNEIMIQESTAVIEKFGVPRKTIISAQGIAKEIGPSELTENESSLISITKSGYIKRIPMKEIEAQSRGGKGKSKAKFAVEEDTILHSFVCSDHDGILLFTTQGKAYHIRAYQIPMSTMASRGQPLPQLFPALASKDDQGVVEITSAIPRRVTSSSPSMSATTKDSKDVIEEETTEEGTIPDTTEATTPEEEEDVVKEPEEAAAVPIEDDQKEYLMLLSRKGILKKLRVSEFDRVTARGLIAMTMKTNDSLAWARLCDANAEIIVATRHGYATKFPISEISVKPRRSQGVLAMKVRKNDFITDCDIYSPPTPTNTNTTNTATAAESDILLLAVTDRGFGKTIDPQDLRTLHRRTKGVRVIKYKTIAAEDGRVIVDHLRSFRVCSIHDEVMLSTLKGKTIRQKIQSISSQSRYGTGVKLQTIDEEDDYITSVNIIPSSTIEEEVVVDGAEAVAVAGVVGEGVVGGVGEQQKDELKTTDSKDVVAGESVEESLRSVPSSATVVGGVDVMKPRRGRKKKSVVVPIDTAETIE